MRNGGYSVRNDVIYVHGSVDGKRYRKSTGKKATPANLTWIKKNFRDVLLKLIDKEKPSQKVFLKEFGLDVIEMSAHKRGKPTQKDYLSKFRKYILPYFSSYKLDEIKPIELEKWQNALLLKLSTSSVKRVRNIMYMIMHKAVANELILRNPVDYVETFNIEMEKRRPYSLDEMSLMLKNTEGFLKIYLYIAFTTGMRTGELIGLKWSDIDFERSIVHINRSITKGVITSSNSKKNHNRFAILPDFVVDALKKFKQDSEWVFTAAHGGPYYDSKTILKYYFKPLLKKLDIKYKTIYATRHTFISIMRNNGMDKNFIQEQVGHAKDSDITDKNYTTWEVTDQKIAAVNNVFCSLKDQDFGHNFGTVKT